MTRGRVFLIVLVGLVVLLAAGPRVDLVGEYVPFPEETDIVTWVSAQAEAQVDIVPGTEHRVIWAGEPRRQTGRSIVYLHGFSGSSAMAYPFVDSLALALGANTYIPRLTGHGRGPDALAAASLADWVQDTADAMAIGARLGEQVILVGLSTGGTLAAWAALAHPLAGQVEALVLISPNIRPVDPTSEILLWPWGGRIAQLVAGPTRDWEPFSEDHARYTTNHYSTAVLPQMMGTIGLLRSVDPEDMQAPVLVLLSGGDKVVSAEKTRDFYARIPTRKSLVDVGDVGDPNNHVIVGDALSPDNTMPAVRHVLRFLQPD